MLWRQGDVYIEAIELIPPAAVPLPDVVLADGEATGHQHRIDDPRSAVVYDEGGQLYLEVTDERTRLVHEEHAPIQLTRGSYRVWRQREYDPGLFAFGNIDRLVKD